MTIVLVEDDLALNRAMTLLLERNHFRVASFRSGDALIEQLPSGPIDLFILDINLPDPDMDGFGLLEILRPYFENSDFIFISSYTDMVRINKAFSLGCEDYLKKPFDVQELLLRIRRVQDRRSIQGVAIIDDVCRFNIDNRTLEFKGRSVTLTDKESRVLQLLLNHRGHVVTYEMFSELVWGENVHQNTIAAVIKRLREKMQTSLLQTVRKRGYCLLPQTPPCDGPEDS